MARWEFKLPDVGEGVTEGEIVAWLVAPGDPVREDQPVVEVMTDKATVTIAAPRAGTVVETRGKVGEIVPVHSVLVVFELEGAAPPAHGGDRNGTHAAAPPTAAGARPASPGEAPPAPGGGAGYFSDKPLAAPATRKLAREMRVDLRRVPPTGPQGRVTRDDVLAFGAAPVPAPSRQAHAPLARPAHPVPAPAPKDAGFLPDERIPFAGLRRKIAQKMAASTSTAAHFTFVEECDVSELKALRASLKDAAEARGARLTFLPFIVKAVVAALRKHPMLNATLDEERGEIVLHRRYNIGIATATDAGLVVPVVKDADRKTLLEVAADIDRVSAETRAGKVKLDDLHGSTFTITSLGAQGGLLATPIINFPEVAILGVHQMKTRPVVRDGQIVIGDVMLLSLSFDHRLVDGHVGAAFAYDVIALLEKPGRMLLDMR
jgi:pyruvate dehydrogenase E2 component (dihydrolipoamide acetyltransferase)